MSYRPNVAVILRKQRENVILVCERNDYPGCWQFPQGGVKVGEDLQEAVYRELKEEINLAPEDVEIIERRSGYRYRFPRGQKKNGWIGQDQTYFLTELREGHETRLTVRTAEPEFRAFRWILPEDFDLRWLPESKRATYRKVFRDFFEVDIAISKDNPYRGST